ncbi:hypothetical protein Tco_1246492, partial [Tanacetum coccineum]
EKPGHVRPANGFYEKLNALMFVPQQELSSEQAYWLPANERASQTSNPTSPVIPFVHKGRPPSQVLASLRQVNAAFHQFEDIIKERTTKKPDYVSEWCFDYAKQFVEQQLVPFYDHFKKHIQAANETFFKEIREFEQIFDELEAEYEQCVLDNKNLTIEKKNLLIKNDCLIAECLEKDICSIVLTSDIVVPPSSNCLCEDLRSACDREHTKVLELEAEVLKQQKMVIESEKRNSHLQKNHIDLQLKFQNYKQCIDTSSASNAIFEINKLRKQLQGKDDTIRNLDAQVNIMKVLNVGPTTGSCDQQALEIDRIQLKDTITSLRIQLDGLKVENVSLKRWYDELSQANTHSCTAYTETLSALTAENIKLKAQVTGNTSSGPSTSETPKVLAPGMYNLGSKYIPPSKRASWVKPTPLPKKKQVTFSEPPKPSLKPTQKPVEHPNKQTNVCVPMSTGVKPTSGASKTVSKRAPRNHSSLSAKSANARIVEAHHRTLNKKNRVDSNLLVKHSIYVSNLSNVCGGCNKSLVFANHNDCQAWRQLDKVVGSVSLSGIPTGRHLRCLIQCPLIEPPIFFDDDDDDDEESSIPLRDLISELPLSIAITPDFDYGLSHNGDEILIPIRIEIGRENELVLRTLLLIINESYLLFDEVLENIESKDSYVSNLNEPALLVTPLSDFNEDKCFDPGGKINEIDAFLDMDISTDIENGYHDRKGDLFYLKFHLKSMVKVFDPVIHEENISPTYVSLPLEDRHYLSFKELSNFLPYFTYPDCPDFKDSYARVLSSFTRSPSLHVNMGIDILDFLD